MRLVVVLLSLLSFAMQAQSVSPIERSYGPYARPRVGAAPAIAASRTGVLLAWSETDPITGLAGVRFGLLDFTGRLLSEISSVPTSTQAFAPLLASDGDTFLLVWAEESRLVLDDARSIGMHIDASGHALSNPVSYSARNPLWLAWSDSQYSLGVGGGGEVRVARDGTRLGTLGDSPGVPIQGARVIASSGLRFCWCSLPPVFDVHWTIDGFYGGRTYVYQSGSAPAFDGDGVRFLIVWSSPRGVEGILATRARQLTDFTIPADVDQKNGPAVAFDGASYLVSWYERENVFGLLVDANGFPGGPFPIATSGRREAKPRVYALREGRFLVVYESDMSAADTRFAGRIITTDPPRRRAIR